MATAPFSGERMRRPSSVPRSLSASSLAMRRPSTSKAVVSGERPGLARSAASGIGA